MDKKYWLICGIVAGIISLLMFIFIFALPPAKKSSANSDSKEHSTPKQDNINLWASFPGDLNTKTYHNFGILEYSEDMKSASTKAQIKLEEQTQYENIEFGDKIEFEAVNKYIISEDNSENKNGKFNGLSLGAFETLETLSNPKDYQQGINSIFYLIQKAFQSSDIFIRHLYSYSTRKSLTDDEIRNNILKNIDKERQDKIINGESEYCLKTALGFDHWVKLIDNDEAISKATWLKELFGLKDDEIKTIFSKEEYLYTNWIACNLKLAEKFCGKKDKCGNEIIYEQLIDGKVVNYVLEENKNSLTDLYAAIKKEYYPFESSPELFNYFNIYKAKHSEATDYKDYTLTAEQLELLIDENSEKSLLSSNKSIEFLTKLASNDPKSIANNYGINEKIPQFIKEYIYEYLPKLFIYREFKEGDKTYTINPFVKLFSNMAFDANKKTYYQINKLKIENFFKKIYTTLVFKELQNSVLIKDMGYDDEDFCYLIVQTALDDGRKALKICHDPITTIKSKDDVLKWQEPYSCVMESKTDCNMTLINHIKEIVYITEEEIKKLYESYNFGKIINEYYKSLSGACGDKCSDDNYLFKIQFWKSSLTKDLPFGKSCDSLSEVLPELIPEPFELNYYFKKKKISEDIPESSIELLMTITPSTDNNILSEDNFLAFNNLYELEKKFVKALNQNDAKDFRLFELLNGALIFDTPRKEYDSIEHYLQGNEKEDKSYIEYLSKGEYFNNYNPGIKKTTGFNFGIDLDSGKATSMNYDNYTIDTETLRKIVDINGLQFMNMKKEEYDYISKKNILVIEPSMNYDKLNGDKAYIDGFQYNHEDDTIYYLDKISSGVYKFTFKEEVDYKDDVTCRKYNLDTTSLDSNNNNVISQKLNKPFAILANKEGLKVDIKDEIKTDNYICVEPYSNMVIDSKINFIYSLNTKNYGYLYYLLPKEATNYPMFIYNKEYTVEIESFNKAFPSIKSYHSFKKTILIIGIIFTILFCALSCFCIYMYIKQKKERISLPSEGLVNTSREEGSTNKIDE